jgi:cytosine/adenosine deaminase-related metal-dependent hydrolase
MKGAITPGSGLGDFIEQVNNTRNNRSEFITSSAQLSDNDMFKEGVSLCADICNTSLSFKIKSLSRIKYYNLLEVFGIDPEKAERRMAEILKVAETSGEMNLPYSIVPHSIYAMSLKLLKLIRDKTENNKVTSVHFMETSGEKDFLENHSGPLLTSFERSSLIPSNLETVNSHSDAVLNEITLSGNLIVVHNTFTDRETIGKIKERNNLYWCLCPNSNIYIENKIPPLDLLLENGCEIVIGTDSLASNNRLSMIEELKTLQKYFPDISLIELVFWATLNGAKALGEEERFGRIEVGKKPGLVLLENVDLINLKLLPGSFVTRLI